MVRISEPNYFIEAIWRLREQATFEELRTTLLDMQQALVDEAIRAGRSGNRRGRAAGPQSGNTLWTTTRDVLLELRTVGLLVRDAAIPSTKEELEDARHRRYELTPAGKALLPLVERRYDNFAIYDRFLMLQYQAHNKVRLLFTYLVEKSRLALPVCDIRLVDGDVSRWLKEIAGYLDVTEWDGVSFRPVSASVMDRLRSSLVKTPAPTGKNAAQWLDEAIGNAALAALGLNLSYVTVESTAALLARYFVVGRTFYLPSFRGQVIYSIAEIVPGRIPAIERPRFEERKEAIHLELIRCLERLGPGQHAIWKVRSEVAYALRVSDTAVDKVLVELRRNRTLGSLRLAFLNDFVGALPPSARPLVVGREAFYQIAVLLPRPEDEPHVNRAA